MHEWNMEMDSAFIHQPHWLRYSMTSRDRILYAPTGSANSPMSGIVEHVLGFPSSKYVRLDESEFADDTYYSMAQNYDLSVGAGTGSFEYTGQGSADNRDTTVLLSPPYLWHYTNGAITEAVSVFATPPTYVGQGVFVKMYLDADTNLYATVDTTYVYYEWDYENNKLDTVTNIFDGATATECYIVWNDTSILATAQPCSVLSVTDSAGAAEFKKVKIAAPPAMIVDRAAYRDNIDYILWKFGTTVPAVWVDQGTWPEDDYDADDTVKYVGDLYYQEVNIFFPQEGQAGAWAEWDDEAIYLNTGEVWRVREPMGRMDTVNAGRIVYVAANTRVWPVGLNWTGDYALIFEAEADPPADTDSLLDYIRGHWPTDPCTSDTIASGLGVNFDAWFGWAMDSTDTIEADKRIDSVKIAWMQKGQHTGGILERVYPHMYYKTPGGSRTNFWYPEKLRWDHDPSCNAGLYKSVPLPSAFNHNDSLLNGEFGIHNGSHYNPRVHAMWLEVYSTDTTHTDTAWVTTPHNFTTYDGAHYALDWIAFAPWAFDFDDGETDSLIFERAPKVTSWSTTSEGNVTYNRNRRGIVHRRRAWYCQNDTALQALIWSDLNKYTTTTDNAETLEGNDPLVGLSSFGQQMIGYRRRSGVSVSGFAEGDFYEQPIPSGVGAASHDVIARSSTHNVDVLVNEQGLWTFDGSRISKVSGSFDEIFEDSINWAYENLIKADIYEDRYWLSAPFGADTINSRLMVFDVTELGDVQMTFLGTIPAASVWNYTGTEGDEYLFLGTTDSTVIYRVGGDDDVTYTADYRSGWLETESRLRALRYEIGYEAGVYDSLFIDFYVDYSDTPAWSDTIIVIDEAARERHHVSRSVQGDQIAFGIGTRDAAVTIKSFAIEVAKMGDRIR
jgi:hypothetical protein